MKKMLIPMETKRDHKRHRSSRKNAKVAENDKLLKKFCVLCGFAREIFVVIRDIERVKT
jgi:hypothetical protein